MSPFSLDLLLLEIFSQFSLKYHYCYLLLEPALAATAIKLAGKFKSKRSHPEANQERECFVTSTKIYSEINTAYLIGSVNSFHLV